MVEDAGMFIPSALNQCVILLAKTCSVGAGLQELFRCAEVHHYLFGTPMKELASHKDIYSRGILRKVINNTFRMIVHKMTCNS